MLCKQTKLPLLGTRKSTRAPSASSRQRKIDRLVWDRIFWSSWSLLLKDNEGAAVTVTSERYVAMLRNFCEPELRRRGIDLLSVWFQQDGERAHTVRASMNVLREIFPQHVISCGGDVPWPARSPDLSACDYSLWGYLWSRVFISKPRSIAELKQSIKEEILRSRSRWLVGWWKILE